MYLQLLAYVLSTCLSFFSMDRISSFSVIEHAQFTVLALSLFPFPFLSRHLSCFHAMMPHYAHIAFRSKILRLLPG